MTKKRELRGLLGSIPMPLAQLGKRALNAPAGIERHNAAFYMLEATLKLAAAGRICLWIKDGLVDPSTRPADQARVAQSLQSLALPSLGHWFGYLRDVSDALDKAPSTNGRALAAPAKRIGQTPKEWKAVPAFARASVEAGAVKPEIGKNGEKRGILGFFEVLVGYRNEVIGHGAQREQKFYSELGELLLEAAAEIFSVPELFAGLHLAVARIELEEQKVKTTFKDLTGLAALPLDDSADGATAGHLYLLGEGSRIGLYPLVRYEEVDGVERFAFLNKTAGAKKGEAGDIKRVELLDYVTGESAPDAEAVHPMNAMLGQLRMGETTVAPPAEAKPDEVKAEEPAQVPVEGQKPAPKSKPWLLPVVAVLGFGLLAVIAYGAATREDPSRQDWSGARSADSSAAGTTKSSPANNTKATPRAPAASAPSAVTAQASATQPKIEWSHGLGGEGLDTVKSVVSGKDHVFAVVETTGKVVLPTKDPYQSIGKRDAIVFALSPSGSVEWATPLSNHDDLDIRLLRVAKNGHPIVGGLFAKKLTIGSKTVEALADWGYFLAELDAANGEVQTLRSFANQELSLFAGQIDLAVTESGDWVVGGAFGGKLDVGCGAMTAEGLLDAFVATLDPAGKCRWAKRFGDFGLQSVESVGVDVSGDIVLAGGVSGTLDFGGQTVSSSGGINAFVAKLDSKGEHKWSHSFGSGMFLQAGGRVATHLLGSVFMAGWFEGTVDFGRGPVTAKDGHDIYLLHFDPNGKLRFAKQLPVVRAPCSPNECYVDELAVGLSASGAPTLFFPFSGSFALGNGQALTSAGGTDFAFVTLDVDGNITHALQLGDETDQCTSPRCWATSTHDPKGKLLLGGGFYKTLPPTSLKSESELDGFVLSIRTD